MRNRLLPLLLATLTTVGVLSAAPAMATEELPPGGTFTDDNGLAQEGWIEAIAAVNVTRGCNRPDFDQFCPHRSVTRAEMATFLVNAFGFPAVEGNPFVDTDDTVHKANIAALYTAGVTKGCGTPEDHTFCPDRTVTRGEMAAFVSRAMGLTGEVDVDRFSDDDDSIFETDISRIAAAGITSGCDTDRYCPRSEMLRRHMAVFLGRALDLTPIDVPPGPAPIGSFTTYYDRCSDPCRVTNIQLIADAVDGVVVEAGETFSINAHVGQRTEAKGYVPAGAIIGGELYCCDHPANIGGGTSQFATTLYNAVFFAGLEDVYHRPHSIWFARYPMGREATLGYTSPDLKFRNDTEWPVEIDVSYTETSITVTIIGVSEVVDVESIRTGSATTSDGGSVSIKRIITYSDNSTKTETWYHTYNGLPEEDPDEPPPIDEDGTPPPPPGPDPL